MPSYPTITSYACHNCGYWTMEEFNMALHMRKCNTPLNRPTPDSTKITSQFGGTRQPLGRRYDLVFEEFGEALDAWAEIAHYGEQKHGNKNWWKLDFTTEQNPLNHAIGHLRKAMSAPPGEYRRRQLAKVLWNVAAQMRFDSKDKHEESMVPGKVLQADPTKGP